MITCYMCVLVAHFVLTMLGHCPATSGSVWTQIIKLATGKYLPLVSRKIFDTIMAVINSDIKGIVSIGILRSCPSMPLVNRRHGNAP